MAIKTYKEERPWGRFLRFTKNEPSTVKILTIKRGEEFSLQTHEHREEFWYVISGEGEVVVGDSTIYLSKGDEFNIPSHTKHRIKAKTEVNILEIAIGDFDEDDISRIEDKYHRN